MKHSQNKHINTPRVVEFEVYKYAQSLGSSYAFAKDAMLINETMKELSKLGGLNSYQQRGLDLTIIDEAHLVSPDPWGYDLGAIHDYLDELYEPS